MSYTEPDMAPGNKGEVKICTLKRVCENVQRKFAEPNAAPPAEFPDILATSLNIGGSVEFKEIPDSRKIALS